MSSNHSSLGRYIIGLDYGTESARGVLIDVASGNQCGHHIAPYKHRVLSSHLPAGKRLPQGWALQVADDYVEAAEKILSALGRDKSVLSIGIDFTASSPLPSKRDGTPLSQIFPDEPHAYVKLWKHSSAQSFADRINAEGGSFLNNFDGKLSGEWLIAKADQLKNEAPWLWREADRFIEAGDWIAWNLTGEETRSTAFASYKAQYNSKDGYPKGVVKGLDEKLAAPLPIGSPAGRLTDQWREKTGIIGNPTVAVAAIGLTCGSSRSWRHGIKLRRRYARNVSSLSLFV